MHRGMQHVHGIGAHNINVIDSAIETINSVNLCVFMLTHHTRTLNWQHGPASHGPPSNGVTGLLP